MRTQLTALLSLILLFGFLTTNIINYNLSKRLVRESIIGNSLPLARDNIYSEIQRDLMRPIFVSSLMANDTFLKDWVNNGEEGLQSITRYLKEVKEKYGFFSSFYVSDKTQKYYHFKGLHKIISPGDDHDSWYYDFKSKNVKYDLDVDTNEAEHNHLTIFINHRLTNYDDSFLGVVGVGLNFDSIASLLDEYTEKYKRSIFLVDPDGLVQVHPHKEHILKTNILEQEGIKEVAADILTNRDQPVFFEYEIDGQHILLTSRYIKELDWYLLVEQNQTKAMASVKSTFVKNLVFSLLITLITILITVWVINYFQKQLEVMATRDKLTGAYNRNGFERKYAYLEAMAKRGLVKLSMIMIDIDNFKQINDIHGHLQGDTVIRLISQKSGEAIRRHDLLVRWGGDEFVIIITGDLSQAEQIAERISRAIDQTEFLSSEAAGFEKASLNVSISCGISQRREDDTFDSFASRADRALYLAKHQGRHAIFTENNL
jgi:diguanylate cyclase (GGDEF)-like protein